MGDQSDDWLRTLATVPGSIALPPGNLQTMVNLLRFGPSTTGIDGPSWAGLAAPPPGQGTPAQSPVDFSQDAVPNSDQDGYNNDGTSWADMASYDPSGQGANSSGNLYAGNDPANAAGSGRRLTDAEIEHLIFNQTHSSSGSNAYRNVNENPLKYAALLGSGLPSQTPPLNPNAISGPYNAPPRTSDVVADWLLDQGVKSITGLGGLVTRNPLMLGAYLMKPTMIGCDPRTEDCDYASSKPISQSIVDVWKNRGNVCRP